MLLEVYRDMFLSELTGLAANSKPNKNYCSLTAYNVVLRRMRDDIYHFQPDVENRHLAGLLQLCPLQYFHRKEGSHRGSGKELTNEP